MRFYTNFRDIGYLIDLFFEDEARGIIILLSAMALILSILAFSAVIKSKK